MTERPESDASLARRPARPAAASAGSCSRIWRSSRWQALARLQAELLGERQASLLVDLERLRLPVRAVEREHELPTKPLSQRVVGDELLQLADQLTVPAEGEIGFDSLLLGTEAKLVEPCDLSLGE